jgi:uncharacterized protein YdhG (YjbR/CyaY superfamily)
VSRPDTRATTAEDRIEAYLAALPQDQRDALEALRRTILAAAPQAVETFGYGMPGFKYRGRPLIGYAAWKAHCSIYGSILDEFRDELAPYALLKGTIRFTTDAPLPPGLIERLVRAKIAALDESAE